MNYQINLMDAGKNKLALVKVINDTQNIGLKEAKNIVDLLGKVGVYDDYKKAVYDQSLLEEAGATTELIVVSGKELEPREQFLARLIDGGGSISLPIDVIMDITGSEFEEARKIVDNLAIVAENLNIKEALHIKEMLEAVGAKVRIEQMPSLEPEPEPDPKPEPETEPEPEDDPQSDIDDSNTIHGSLTDNKGQPLVKFSITVCDSNIRKWLSLIDRFKDN